MKRFNVIVNGTPYDVQLEEIAAGAAPAVSAPVAPPVAPKAAPAAPAAPAPAAAPSAPAGAVKVNSPMPGNILDIKVSVGQQVAQNQVLLVLEAMKMENDIVAPSSGVVAGIHVRKGDSIDTGALLVSLS